MLGSYFFHDAIPWDDDVDVEVDFRDYPRFKRIFQNESMWLKFNLHGFHDSSNEYDFKNLSTTFPDREDHKFRYHKVKIYRTNTSKTFNLPWRWPFIDISYYKQNLTHVWNYDSLVQYTPISEFYPLHLRPYMGMWLPVPRKPTRLLRRNYRTNTFLCKSEGWNHKKETLRMKKVSIPCRDIGSAYAIISRQKYGNGTIEKVQLSGAHMYSVYIDECIEDATLRMQ